MIKGAVRYLAECRMHRPFAIALPLTVLLIGSPAAAADGQWAFVFALILLGALPLVAVAAMTWPLQVIHRRVRSLGLNPGWTLMTAVWVISLLGLVYATGRVRKGDWLSAIVEKMPIALAVMLLAFGLFLIFANVSATRSTSNVTRAAWWAARLSALHITLLLFPTIAIGLAMPPFGILFLPVYVLFGTHSGAVSGLLQAGHQILSLGFHKDLQPILHWLDAAIFCAALYYLVLRQDDDEAPSSTGRPRSTPGGSLAAPRASFGKRGG